MSNQAMTTKDIVRRISAQIKSREELGAFLNTLPKCASESQLEAVSMASTKFWNDPSPFTPPASYTASVIGIFLHQNWLSRFKQEHLHTDAMRAKVAEYLVRRANAREEQERERYERAQIAAQERRKAEMPKITRRRVNKTQIAKEAGINIRRLHLILNEGTSDKVLAKHLADKLGMNISEIFRPSRNSGRPRVFPFSEFLRSGSLNELADDIREPLTTFNSDYYLLDKFRPNDFTGLHQLASYLQLVGMRMSSDTLSAIWTAFRIWRERAICDERCFDIELGLD